MLQVVLAGLAQGVVVGLIGLGCWLAGRATGLLPLAHGDLMVFSVVAGVLLVVGRTPSTADLGVLASLSLVAPALGSGVLLAAAISLVTVLPVMRRVPAGRLGPAVALRWVAGSLAAGLLMRTAVTTLLPVPGLAAPDPVHLDSLLGENSLIGFGHSQIESRAIVVLLIGLALGWLTELVAVRSRWGRSVRAVCDDHLAAQLCGIDVRRVVIALFMIIGALAGAAGLLAAPGRNLSVEDGVLLGLQGIAAARLAGSGGVSKVMIAGLAVGVVQSLSAYVLGAGFYSVAPLVMLLMVLVARPIHDRRPTVVRSPA